MNDIERLLAIEEIKQVKAKYFYGLDHKDWDLWQREVWAPDGRLEVPEADTVVEPFEKVREWVSASCGDQVSVHHGHMPIITFTSDTEAKVIWAMEDRLYRIGQKNDVSVVRYRTKDTVDTNDIAPANRLKELIERAVYGEE